MTSATHVLLIASMIFVLFSTHPGQLAIVEESGKNDDARPIFDNVQTPVEVPSDVLLNTLYYLVGDVEYIPQGQGMPIYHAVNLNEPKYVEIKLKPHGYLLASLTKEDLPVIRFNGEISTKIPTVALGDAYKYVIYDESFDITAVDVRGKVVKSLSNLHIGKSISDLGRLAENQTGKKKLQEEAEQRWVHDYVMECDRGHTIPICSDKFEDGGKQLKFPDDFGISEAQKGDGVVWDNVQKTFVELEKKGDIWVNGASASPWNRNHISMVIEKKVGKCGFAKVNVPCDDKIFNSPIWIGDTRITFVKENLNDVDESQSNSNLLVSPETRGSWSTWSSWTTSSADGYNLVPEYDQHTCCGCISGCGPVAWAMLFAWADQNANFKNTIYGTATDIPPSTMTPAVQTYVEEIRSQVNTFCIAGSGATYPWKMDNVRGWFQSRGGGNLQTRYNILGIRTDSLRDCARDSIVSAKRPVVIGTGWLTHYPVATQYRVRSRSRNIIFGIKQTENDHEAYVNQGWGVNTSAWQKLSTWFCGTISP